MMAVALKLTVFVIVPRVAERIAQPLSAEVEVKMNGALAEPAGTVTEAGTTKAVLVDFKAIVAAEGEAAVNVTVQDPDLPGIRAVGEQTSDDRAAGVAASESVTETVLPFIVALTVAVWAAV